MPCSQNQLTLGHGGVFLAMLAFGGVFPRPQPESVDSWPWRSFSRNIGFRWSFSRGLQSEPIGPGLWRSFSRGLQFFLNSTTRTIGPGLRRSFSRGLQPEPVDSWPWRSLSLIPQSEPIGSGLRRSFPRNFSIRRSFSLIPQPGPIRITTSVNYRDYRVR